MSETARGALLRYLLAEYDDLKRSLSRRLKSEDFANDVLHDTYLRVNAATEFGAIENPKSYLYRIAMNIAIDHHRADQRRLPSADLDAVLELQDATPSPAQIAESRSDVAALKRALLELPVRRRRIFVAVWLHGTPRPEVAKQFKLSERTIKTELKLARDYCAKFLAAKPVH